MRTVLWAAAVLSVVISPAGAQVSPPSPGAAPWFVAEGGVCQPAQTPSERVQGLRRAGDRAARAIPYRPAGATGDSEPTRFTVQRGQGRAEVFFRTQQDCRSSGLEQNAEPAEPPRSSVMDTLARIRNAPPAPAADRSGASAETRSPPAPPTPAAQWWGISSLGTLQGLRCEPERDGPAGLITNARTLGMRYQAHDVTEPSTGRVIETTIQIPDTGLQVTFYRDRERCQAIADQRMEQARRERDREERALDRYR